VEKASPLTRLGRTRAPQVLPLPRNSEPWVIAHRGASSDVAEHTLPAYLEAIDLGAHGLECDVRLTRDGHLVCVHDRTVNRTSNGIGAVSELDLSGLRELDFGSWKAPLAPPADDDGAYLAGVAPDRLSPGSSQVLTLETLLAVVADAPRPLQLLIETKHPTRYGGLVEKELVRALHRFGFAGRSSTAPGASAVTVMSFAPTALRRIRLLGPGIPLVLLTERHQPTRRDGSLPSGVRVAGPSIRLLRGDPGFVERAHRLGNRVYCWTVDDPADVRLLADLGVDAIITNRPAAARETLAGLA
jgi:glycerophosphoryl diester phosphodiesterase